MKIHQFPLGARFEYEGDVFTKTGPMTARGEQSGPRLIPRHVVLQPPAASAEKPPAAPRCPLDDAGIIAALDEFCATCEALLDASRRPALQDARQRFLDRLAPVLRPSPGERPALRESAD